MSYELAKGKGKILIVPQNGEGNTTKPPQRLDRNELSTSKPQPTSTRTEADKKWHITRGQAK